jgi:starch phosphorylase
MEPIAPERAKLPALPPRLEGLAALAVNIAWSWHRQARALFRRIDPVAWRQLQHNPIAMLRELPAERLEALTRDTDFLAHYDQVMEWFAVESTSTAGWFRDQYPAIATDRPIAYFCAEFGLHK